MAALGGWRFHAPDHPGPSDAIPVEAALVGLRQSEWIEASSLSRSTCFELIKAAEITPETRKVADVRRPVSWLTPDQVERLDALARLVKDGKPVGVVVAKASRAITPTRAILPALRVLPDRPGTSGGSSQTVQDHPGALEPAGAAAR